MTKYEKLAKELESSGLTHKAYAAKRGIGISTVSYYLKRYRASESKKTAHQFKKVEVKVSKGKVIRIRTGSGIEVELPL